MRNENELMNYAMKQESVCRKNDSISDALFEEYGVNRGLRDMNGKGVLTGLTTISKIVSFEDVNGVKTPCDGQLWYRGYNVQNLVRQMGENGFGLRKQHTFCCLEKCRRKKNSVNSAKLWLIAGHFPPILPGMSS